VTKDDNNQVAPETPSNVVRPGFRRFYALPPWFAAEVAAEPQAPDLRDRLIAWFKEQRLEAERREAAERQEKDGTGGAP
jgi:hypothetical protein